MSEEDRGGVASQCLPHHLSGVDRRTVDGAPEHLLDGDDPMAGIQEQHHEHLVLPGFQAAAQVADGIA